MDSKDEVVISATELICKTQDLLDSILNQVKSQESRKVTDFLLLNIEIDLENILKIFPILGNAFVKSNNQVSKNFREILFSLLTANKYALLSTPDQISVHLKYHTFPEGIFATSIHDVIKNARFGHVIMVSGKVLSLSGSTKFVSSTSYKCQSAKCRNSDVVVYRHFQVGFSESNVFRRDLNCEACRGLMIEDVNKRMMSEKRKLKVKLIATAKKEESGKEMEITEEIFSTHEARNSELSRTEQEKSSESTKKLVNSVDPSIHPLNLVMRGKDIPKLEIGQNYDFLGQPVYGRVDYASQYVTLPLSIEVFSIWPEQIVNASIELGRSDLPPELVQLKQACEYSDWSFVVSLAFSFASEICHPTSFCCVKLAILLSLVSGESSENSRRNGNIHLLVVTQEHTLVSRIFAYGLEMCKKGGSLSGSVQSEMGAIFQREGNAPGDLIGGSLALAGNGVCFTPLFDFLKKEEKEKIQKALETGLVPVKVAKGLSNDDKQIAAPSTTQIPLNSAVWVCSEKTVTQFRTSKTLLNQGSLSKHFNQAFVDLFTLALTTQSDEEHLDSVQTDLILAQAMGSESEKLIERGDIEKWIEKVAEIRVEMSEEAIELLNTFYLASRRIRQSNFDSCQISMTSLDALISLAVASAKLNLREKVLKCDAILSIVLFEESMISRFGYSVIGAQNNLLGWAPNRPMSEIIGKQFDERMKMLSQQIDTFCKTHGPISREF